MFDFNFGKKTILGIDIGTSSIKIVELTLKSGKPFLSNYAWISAPDLERKKGENQSFFETIASEYIKKIVKSARFKGKKAFFSIPAYDGLVTLIDFPDMPPEEIDQAIRFEAQKYIPASLEDVALSWQVLDKDGVPESKKTSQEASKDTSSDKEKKNKILLVAISKNKALECGRIAKAANLDLAGIEIETVAMLNSLVGHDKGNFLIVDIGYRICNMMLIKKGSIALNRNIDAGGDDFTAAIAKAMGITEKRAEDIKFSNKNFFAPDSNLHFSTLDVISGEISRIINLQGNFTLDAIILSGGTAKMTGMAEYLQKKFAKKVIIGNPFSRVSYDKKYELAIMNVAPKFSVAAGMAMLGIEKNKN